MNNKKYVLDLAKEFGFDKEEIDHLSQSINNTSLSRRMSVLRAKHNITQSEMASKLNVKESYIYNIECCNKDNLTIGEIDKYLKVLGYKISYRIHKIYK